MFAIVTFAVSGCMPNKCASRGGVRRFVVRHGNSRRDIYQTVRMKNIGSVYRPVGRSYRHSQAHYVTSILHAPLHGSHCAADQARHLLVDQSRRAIFLPTKIV